MLIGNYKIESDSLNITVFEKMLSKKSGESYWKPIGYFSNVQNALRFMVDLEVNKTELKVKSTLPCRECLNRLYYLLTTRQVGEIWTKLNVFLGYGELSRQYLEPRNCLLQSWGQWEV